MPSSPGFITLTLIVEAEGKRFVSRCVELGVTSAGRTIDEAARNIKEATFDYLNAIEELGERRRIFKEKGIIIRKKPPIKVRREYRVTPDTFVSPYVTKVPVPAGLVS